ncbi:hypothetical protein [Streptomyces sp. NPDC002851]
MSETMTTQAVAYHWIMSLQTEDGRQATTDGTLPISEGVHTREQAYAAVYAQVKQHFGLTDVGATVLFFSIDRDVLGTGGGR